MLAAGSGRFALPRVKDLGPLLIAWATSLAVLFLEKDLGASLLYFAVFVVMLWIASGRPLYLLVGLVLFVAGALGRVPGPQPRAAPRRLLAARAGPDEGVRARVLQLAQGQFALASGGMVGTGLGQGSPGLIPYAFIGLHLRGDRRGARAAGHGRDPADLPDADRTEPAGRHRTDRRVRQAPGDRPHDDRRGPDVRDRRRRDPADPADRHHAAVRVVRRVEPGRELRDPGAPDPRVRRAVVRGRSPREPADPPAGDRARGAVRPAVRAGVLHPGLRGERDRRQPRQRAPPDHRGVQGGARTDHHRRRDRDRAQHTDDGRTRACDTRGTTRRARCSPASRVTTRRSTAGPSWSRR